MIENISFSTTGDGTFTKQKTGIHKLWPYDLLVEVSAVSVNPVDLKLAAQNANGKRILGYDAVGTVVEKGSSVRGVEIGDRVFYAGTTVRDGAHQKLQLVDHRIAAHAPKNLTDAEAAAIPLTALAAWELLFERMGFVPEKDGNKGQQLLMINGAGGVGSIASQIAKWAGFKVTATSSPKNFEWLKDNGVKECVDYHQDLIVEAGARKFDAVVSFYDISDYFPAVAKVVKPFGKVGTIVETKKDLPMNLLKNNNVDFFWEYMFAKTEQQMQIATQGAILAKVAEMLDAGILHTTLTKEFTGGISTETLAQAFQRVAKRAIGKTVISGGVKE